MVPDYSIKFDVEKIRAIAANLGATKECIAATVKFMLYDSARLAANDMIKYSAPWAGSQTLGTFGQQREGGRGAVEKDLDRLFARIDKSQVETWTKKGKHFVRIRGTGNFWEVKPEMWKPENLERVHFANRNRRGRVTRQERQYWVTSGKLNKYTKSVQKRVGQLKAGWLPSAEYFADKTDGKIVCPNWIRSQKTMGHPIDQVDSDGTGRVGIENTNDYSHAIQRSSVVFIERKRNKDIEKWLKVRAKKIVDRMNKLEAIPEALRA